MDNIVCRAASTGEDDLHWRSNEFSLSPGLQPYTDPDFLLAPLQAPIETRLRHVADDALKRLADSAQMIDIAVSAGGLYGSESEAVILEAATYMIANTITYGMRCRLRGRCWISLEIDRHYNRVVVIDDGWDFASQASGRMMQPIEDLAARCDARLLLWRAYGMTVCELDFPVSMVSKNGGF